MTLVTEEKIYNNFAKAYASGEECNFSKKIATWIMGEIVDNERSKKSLDIVDVACGMGEAAIIFAKQGHNVLGIDISTHMLDYAIKKSKTEKVNVKWIQDDMRNLNLTSEVDLVTCMYDAINFMTTQDDIYLVFDRIFKSLRKNGQFIFDMYTLLGLAEKWGSKVEIHTNTDNYFVVSQTAWDVENSINTKILYGVTYNGVHWDKWCEKHVAKAYPIEIIKENLAEVGFNEIRISGWKNGELTELDTKAYRMMIIAKK